MKETGMKFNGVKWLTDSDSQRMAAADPVDFQGRTPEQVETAASCAFWVVLFAIAFIVFCCLAVLAGWITVATTY